MNYLNTLKISLSALNRNKFRTFLTMLGIIIGVASVIAMLAIGQGSKKSIQDQMSDMGTNLIMAMPGSQFRGGVRMGNDDARSMTLDDLEVIREECSAITAVSPEVRASGQLVNGNLNWPSSIYGVNGDFLEIRKYKLESGRLFSEREIKTYAKVCIIGQTLLENLFEEGENPLGKNIRYNNIPFKVIGVLAERGENGMGQDMDDLMLAPYTAVMKRILSITHINGIMASAASEEVNDLAMQQLADALRKSHKIGPNDEDDFRIMSQSELVSTFTSVSDMMTILLGVIAGISLLVGGIGIMNIMFVSVTERTREIGLRLSVGGRERDILLQFLVESILLSILGGAVGILLGILATRVVGSIAGWPVVIMPPAVILSFAVCTAIGVFFGWYPARKAAGLNPIDALRYE
jgi:putative ABC transport system permease protein